MIVHEIVGFDGIVLFREWICSLGLARSRYMMCQNRLM